MSYRLATDSPVTATVFPRPSREEPSGLCELAPRLSSLVPLLRERTHGLGERAQALYERAAVF
jgi:hypothetical protein